MIEDNAETLEEPCIHCGNPTGTRQQVGPHHQLICCACGGRATHKMWAKKPGTSKPRPQISNKRRNAVLKRDAYRCQHCGKSAADNVLLDVDHVIPVAVWQRHGTDLPPFVDDECNLQVLCSQCNNGKSRALCAVDVHRHICQVLLVHRNDHAVAP